MWVGTISTWRPPVNWVSTSKTRFTSILEKILAFTPSHLNNKENIIFDNNNNNNHNDNSNDSIDFFEFFSDLNYSENMCSSEKKKKKKKPKNKNMGCNKRGLGRATAWVSLRPGLRVDWVALRPRSYAPWLYLWVSVWYFSHHSSILRDWTINKHL